MSKFIATPSKTNEILDKYRLQAKKNYGQNFLVDVGIVEKIAKQSIISKPSVVFEIGPGIGSLSEQLAIYSDRVVSFEIDDRLLPVLKDTLKDYSNIEIIHTDFLKVDIKEYTDRFVEEGYHVYIAANLPYYITTPILFKIFESGANIDQITVMMQKEVADRFYAEPNTKDYNALSVITQYRCHIKQLMKISKHVFQPKPNVDSAVVQFRFKEKDKRIKNEDDFFEMVKACFKQRRKTILNNFKEYTEDKDRAVHILNLAKVKENARAESLTLEQFIQLYEVLQHAS